MVEHRMDGWWPGTLLAVFDARAAGAQRDRRDPPAGAPLAFGCADERGKAVVTVPEDLALLVYGSAIDGRPTWVATRARRSEPESEPEPEPSRPQPPPLPRQPSFHTGARGADLGRRR
jgi:hypothetical protein